MSDKTQEKAKSTTRELSQEDAEKLIGGEITPGEFLGLSNERLYKIATLGHGMLKSGQLPQALEIFEGLTAASPYDSVFHCNLAATYARLERFDEAKSSYTRALELNIANVDALVGRGELFLRESKVPEALKDITKALELDPKAERDTTKRARATLMVLQRMAEGK